MDIIAQYLFLCLPLVVHLWHDLKEIGRNKGPNHVLMATVVLVCSVICGEWLYAWTHIPVWRFAFYAVCIHFALFNYLLNYLRTPREPMFYLGNRLWDRLLKPLPAQIRLLLQAVVLLAGWYVYHKLGT